MPEYSVDVQIDPPFAGRVAAEAIRLVALATLLQQDTGPGRAPCELTIVITGDDAIQELNQRFLGHDRPTDVLSFPDDTRGPYANLPGLPVYLGDVIMSFPRAEAQAAEAGHTVEAELQLLAVHGVLHLLGHDDLHPEARAAMWTAQSTILRSMSVPVSLPE